MKLFTAVKRRAKIAVAAGAAILFVAAGAGAYAIINKPLEPQAHMNAATINTLKMSTGFTRHTVTAAFTTGLQVTATITGATSQGNSQNHIMLKVHTGALDVAFSGDVFINGEGTAYVRIQNSPFLTGFLQGYLYADEAEVTALTNDLGNKWIKITPNDLAQWQPAGQLLQCVGTLQKSALQPADETAAAAMLAKTPYERVIKETAGETVQGQATRHYLLDTDVSALMSLISQAHSLQSFKPAVAACQDVAKTLTTEQSPADIVHAQTSQTYEAWVSTSSNQLLRSLQIAKEDSATVSIASEYFYSPATIKEPTEFTPASSLYNRFQTILPTTD